VTKSQNKARAHRGGIETELKLSFPPEAAGRLTDHPALKPPCAGPPRSVHHVSTYFDTPSRELARRGLSLRIRADGPRRVQTLKASAAKSGVAGAAMSRGEWEWPLRDGKPDLALAAGNPIAQRLSADVCTRLLPMVVTDITRTEYTLNFQRSTVEVSLDSGLIAAGDRKQPCS
jgi:triphosphatase